MEYQSWPYHEAQQSRCFWWGTRRRSKVGQDPIGWSCNLYPKQPFLLDGWPPSWLSSIYCSKEILKVENCEWVAFSLDKKCYPPTSGDATSEECIWLRRPDGWGGMLEGEYMGQLISSPTHWVRSFHYDVKPFSQIINCSHGNQPFNDQYNL